jgi:hypothetical protein
MKYRIVRDTYAGYEVQAWRWWWPFWMQCGINTHLSVEEAKEWASRHRQEEVWRESQQ